jgi:prolyl-tRNA editing enzyme YbaK/EbsC (Cys-tRNA(Pro) deacylase)
MCDDGHLRRYVDERALGARVVQRGDAPGAAAGAAAVKSLVLMSSGEPVVVVLLLSDRLDFGRVAAALGVPRRGVRLATADEARRATGYRIGTIPPLGHAGGPLRTLLCAAVAESCAMACGGGGSEGASLCVAVEELTSHTRATVAELRVRVDGGAGGSGGSAGAGGSGSTDAPSTSGRAANGLPTPWPRGAGARVELAAVVAGRRRIAKTLCFASLVPLGLPPLPEGRASHLRRLWAHPETGAACEVQVIMGKTVERSHGSAEAFAAALDGVRPGAALRIVGRVQAHPDRRDAATTGAVLDVICESFELLPPQPPPPPPPPAAAPAPAPAVAAPAPRGRKAVASPPPEEGGGGGGDDADRCWRSHLPVTLVTSAVQARAARLTLAALADAAAAAGGEPVAVGLDAEWAPREPGERGPLPPVQLLQLATPRRVFLFDLPALCPDAAGPSDAASEEPPPGGVPPPPPPPLCEAAQEVAALLAALLADARLLKLGYGLAGDLQRMASSYPRLLPPGWTPGGDGARGLVDIADAAAALAPGARAGGGLSRLAGDVLGAPLDKRQQRSAWGARPLAWGQIVYAAADAAVLPAILDALLRGAEPEAAARFRQLLARAAGVQGAAGE